jgi:ABC-type thiamine transport system ATPase subunit
MKNIADKLFTHVAGNAPRNQSRARQLRGLHTPANSRPVGMIFMDTNLFYLDSEELMF